jgi:hypothetical protein
MSTRLRFSPGETACAAVVAAAVAAWTLLPPIQQDQAYHLFADRRALLGIPNALDVLSNAGFLLAGLWGLFRLRSTPIELPTMTRRALSVFFAGLLLTAFGSSWYHLHPSDATLVWDRLGMTVAFAGVLAAAISQRISERAATPMLYALLASGVGSVLYWSETGSLSAYVLIQFGGMLAFLGLLVLARKQDDVLPWGEVLIWYGLAKLFESADQWLWTLTSGVVAGHALKHLAAAGAGFAIARALEPQIRRAG